MGFCCNHCKADIPFREIQKAIDPDILVSFSPKFVHLIPGNVLAQAANVAKLPCPKCGKVPEWAVSAEEG